MVYGLGSERDDLPAYVVLEDPNKLPVNGTQNWQAGYLPPVHQGTRFRAKGAPVLNLKPAFDQPAAIESLERDLIARFNKRHKTLRPLQPRLDARMASYELAARMQVEASDALDLDQETEATKKMYGIGGKATDSYARRCRIARRLVERGERFVQLDIEFLIRAGRTGYMRSQAYGRESQRAKHLREINVCRAALGSQKITKCATIRRRCR